jgi:hypothetical protein
MAFTAGSPEQAKALKLASQLSALYQTFGAGFSGATAALVVEEYAQKLGFGITGLTTGAGFPPFGTLGTTLSSVRGVAAALQNPRGETMANGINLGAVEGATVGIYMHKFVRSGEDFTAIMFSGLTLASATTVAGSTFQINGAFTAHTNDLVAIGGNLYRITSGVTSALASGKSQVTVAGTIGQVFAANTSTILNLQTIGVTRGTSGIAGSTFEKYSAGTQVNGGFTACVWFGGASGSGTIS